MGSDDRGGKPHLTEAERLELCDALLAGARRGAIARFASSISHALGTPLNVIAGRAAMIGMSEHAAPDDMRQNARIIETQVKNISELLQRTLKFARDGAPEPAPTDLCALAEQVVSLLAPLAAARDASIELRAAAPLVASVPASRLLDTVAVLASWAVRRVAPGQKVSLSVERVESIQPPPGERGRARGGASALFRVRCPGVALSLSLLEHVYEPWLAETTEDRDTAITLAFAFGIAREHRGFVEAKPDGDGTTFLVCWPI